MLSAVVGDLPVGIRGALPQRLGLQRSGVRVISDADMQSIRTYLTRAFVLVLTLILVATGHSAASMRGMSDATGQMVICTGTGPEVVYIDENGQPTSPPHTCPECVLNLLVAMEPPAPFGLPFVAGGQAFGPDEVLLSLTAFHLEATARAPPARN